MYGNFCDPDDFEALAALNVSVAGKVVLCRYGNTFRGLKVPLPPLLQLLLQQKGHCLDFLCGC